MHSDWFNGIEILQGKWQHGEKVGYCYPSGLEKTLFKWDIYVPFVTKGLIYMKIQSLRSQKIGSILVKNAQQLTCLGKISLITLI
jgi:hypothetical protein